MSAETPGQEMNDETEECRQAFEEWSSQNGVWKTPIEKDINGNYKLQQTQSYWVAWQTGWKLQAEFEQAIAKRKIPPA